MSQLSIESDIFRRLHKFRKWQAAILSCLLLSCLQAVHGFASDLLYTPIDRSCGLSDNRLRTISQLPDGRMVFVTSSTIDIYDGKTFRSRELFPKGLTMQLRAYKGHHRTFITGDTLLWVKNKGRVSCVNLRTERNINPREALHGISGAEDILPDGAGGIWIRNGGILSEAGGSARIKLSCTSGEVQDVIADPARLYLFFSTGLMEAYDRASLKPLYHNAPYPETDIADHDRTSLAVAGPDGIYQLRNGKKGGFFFFDTEHHVWRRIMETDYPLNTLAISRSGTAYITCPKGIWEINLQTMEKKCVPELITTEGNLLSTNISTIFKDSKDAIWLGTHDRGVLYASPHDYSGERISISTADDAGFMEDYHGQVYLMSAGHTYRIKSGSSPLETDALAETARTTYGNGKTFVSTDGTIYFHDADAVTIFHKEDTDTSATAHPPILTGLWIHGEPIAPDSLYSGKTVTTCALPFTKALTLEYDQNFLTVEYTAPDYRKNTDIRFRYKLTGSDENRINYVPAAGGKSVLIQYTGLPPGHYILSVECYSGGNSGAESRSELSITIRPPWWRTPAAYICYLLIAALAIYTAFRLHTLYIKKKMEIRHREEVLLTRIRTLIEQCERYEKEKAPLTGTSDQDESDISDQSIDNTDLSKNIFLSKAIALVEANLTTPGYSVEQLSRDLCMERTGLYKKLTSLLDQSPSLFIRNIRLRRAAVLLKSEPDLTISRIAELTGFSSGSYLSKCFQETFGCRPSEYVSQQRKST